MNKNKTITFDGAFELTEDFRLERAIERFTSDVMRGVYDKYIEVVEDLKKAITDGLVIDFIEAQDAKVSDYCFDKINGEEWEVVEEWLSSEGYETEDGLTYTKA